MSGDGVQATQARAWGRYRLDDQGVAAVWPQSDAGVRLVVDGREVTAADLVFAGVTEGPDKLTWRLVGQGLDVTFDADAAGRTCVTVSGAGRLQRVDVERWCDAAGLGLGQPVLGDGWFAALQHPGAEGLGLAVDVDLGAGAFAVPPLIVGRAPAGHELSALWDELDRVRARPPGLVVLANNWYQLGAVGRMDEASVVAELAGFDKVPVPLDWYCLDDPWDGEWAAETGLWGRMDPSRFAGGLAGLAGLGGPSSARIGLWISPWGGYFDRHHARVAWGREHGFEVEDGSWPRLCPAGNRYGAHLAEAMGRFTSQGVGYWKIDGVQFDCDDPGHGHPVGPGGRTTQMDRFAALLDGVRAVDPGVILAFTSGSNPSPWWLRHADFVWRGGLDDDAPAEHEGTRHDRFATYIDGCLDALRDTGLPVSAIVTFSVVENQAQAYRSDGGSVDEWERHCWLLAGRGTHHHDLYVAPDSLSPAEWDALARVLGWARAHERVLARSRMIGGRPQAGEPYGFLSTSAVEGEAVVCVRNPSSQAQGVRVDVGGEIGDLDAVWGRADVDGGRSVVAELDPFEVVVVTGRWQPRNRPGPPG